MTTTINSDWKTVVEQLRGRGVFIAVPLLWGGMIEPSVDDIELFVEDRELFDANRLGMTREEVRDSLGHRRDDSVPGTTTAGTRCKNVAPQGFVLRTGVVARRAATVGCHCHRRGALMGNVPPIILRHEFIEHDLRKLSPRAVTVLLAILSHIDNDRRAYPGLERIGELAGVRWLTAKRAVKELEDAGLLTREVRPGMSTQYVVSERVTPRGNAAGQSRRNPVNSDRGEVNTGFKVDRGTPIKSDHRPLSNPVTRTKSQFTKNQRTKKPPVSPKGDETTEFPAELDNEGFRTAWKGWLAYRRERRLTRSPLTLKGQLKKLAALGTAGAIAEIENSIANGWQSVCYPDRSKWNGNGKTSPPGPGQRHPADANRGRGVF